MAVLFKNALTVLENEVKLLDVRTEGEFIAAVAENIAPAPGDEVIDCSGKTLFPGVIDSHVHYYMRTGTKSGRTADDFLSGSVSAACGGVTSIVDFATPQEGMTLSEAMQARMAEAAGYSHADYTFHMEMTGAYEIDLEELAPLYRQGFRALKIYTTYGRSEYPVEKLPALFRKAGELGFITLVHAEDDGIVAARRKEFLAAGKTAAKYHGASRPIEAETASIRHILALAKEADAPVVIAHISSGAGAALVSEARANGQRVYGETCPHYLTLTEECYRGDAPQRFIMTPPLRFPSDNEALWQCLIHGGVDKISTDHCSFTLEEKLSKEGCFEAIPGIGGSETLLPVLWEEGFRSGRLSLVQLAEKLSLNPARLYGLYPRKGHIAPGADADLVLIDPDRETVVRASQMHSKAGYSVFEGKRIRGAVLSTMRRGRFLLKDGAFTQEPPAGKWIPAERPAGDL